MGVAFWNQFDGVCKNLGRCVYSVKNDQNIIRRDFLCGVGRSFHENNNNWNAQVQVDPSSFWQNKSLPDDALHQTYLLNAKSGSILYYRVWRENVQISVALSLVLSCGQQVHNELKRGKKSILSRKKFQKTLILAFEVISNYTFFLVFSSSCNGQERYLF